VYAGRLYRAVAVEESVADALIKLLAPMQERYNTLAENKKAVQKLLETGSKKARIVAAETLKEAKQKIGLL